MYSFLIVRNVAIETNSMDMMMSTRELMSTLVRLLVTLQDRVCNC